MKFSERVLALAESATLAVSAKAAAMRAKGADVIGFGAGEADFDTPQNIKDAAIAALQAGHVKYPKPASGIPAARQAVCTKLKRDNNLSYSPEQVVITNGGKMAIAVAMQALVEPGDEVLIPAPYWVSFPEMAKLAGATPVCVKGDPVNDFKLSPHDIKSAVTDRTRIVVFNSPANPSGVTYAPDEVRALAAALAEFDVIVMSDETYDRQVYDGIEILSFAAVNERAYAQTLTINSASKTYAMTGWRLGYAAGDAQLIKAMGKILSQTSSGATTFLQYALVEALEGDQSAVDDMRLELMKRESYMAKRLEQMNLPSPRPSGAFFCFPDVSAHFEKLGVSGSAAFAKMLLEQANVAVVPGVAFGVDQNVRLSFANSMDVIEQGMDRIERFLKG